jgi:hypothetical protein
MPTTANLATTHNAVLQIRPHALSRDRQKAGPNTIFPKVPSFSALYLTYIAAQRVPPRPNPRQPHILPHATMLIKAHKGTSLCG